MGNSNLYAEKKRIILSKIYQLRILSYNQILNYVFLSDGKTKRYCDVVIRDMINGGLVEKNGYYAEETYYTITKKGIAFLRDGILPVGVTDLSKTVVEHDMTAPYKLFVSKNISKHQLSLNEFVLAFEKTFPDVDFSYYDEKYVSRLFRNIRPDGIIKVGSTYFFLEMDMNTERETSLRNKFKNYRSFLNSSDFHNLDGKIKVLFIVGGNVNESKRKSDLIDFISDNIEDFISEKFDIYVNTHDKLLAYVGRSINNFVPETLKILNSNGFSISRGSFSNGIFLDFNFDAYVCKLSGSGRVFSENGEAAEFIIDDYTQGNIYTYRKMRNFPSVFSSFKMKKKRGIKYVIAVNSENEAFELVKKAGRCYDNMYFTTAERLSSSAGGFSGFFVVDINGNVTGFKNNDLRLRVPQGNVTRR